MVTLARVAIYNILYFLNTSTKIYIFLYCCVISDDNIYNNNNNNVIRDGSGICFAAFKVKLEIDDLCISANVWKRNFLKI